VNFPLIIAGIFSLFAGLLHLLIIYKGTVWYEFFHAGERIVALSKQGSLIPSFVTSFIAVVLIIWAAYAFSGAQLIGKLPLLKPILIIITCIYLIRGLAIIPLYLFYPERYDPFMLWSSVVCLIIGLFYFIGMYKI